MAAEQSLFAEDKDDLDKLISNILANLPGKSEVDDLDKLSNIIANLPAQSQIVLEIFARLPPPVLFKFRTVSKSFLDLTRQPIFTAKNSVSFKRNTFTGFLYQVKNSVDEYESSYEFDEPTFLPLEHEAGPLPDPCFNFLKPNFSNKRRSGNGDYDDVVELIDSCNGLILCSVTTWKTLFTKFYVCNPLTKEKVSLPHPKRPDNRLNFALMADFNPNRYLQFKVLCLFPRKRDDPLHPYSKLLILSSSTGEWEEIEHAFPPVCHKSIMGSKVFDNGILYWDCLEDHILVCNLNVKENQNCYQLIKAPHALLGRCLWRSHDLKLYCYCHGFSNEFPAWSLSVNENNEYKWEVDGCEDFETLTNDVSLMFAEGRILYQKRKATIPLMRFKIIGYDSASKTMFMVISHVIYSYQFANRNFKYLGGLCPNKTPKDPKYWFLLPPRFHALHRFLPYMHSLGRIEICDVANTETIEGNNKDEKKTQDYSIAIDELASTYEKLANKVKGKQKRCNTLSVGKVSHLVLEESSK